MNLILSNLEYSYPGSAQKILNGIDLMLTPGLQVLMLGANGAGKSTLLKLMSGNLKLQKGTIKLDDQDAVALPDRIRARHIGVMLQTPPPVFDYTAEEFVLFGRNAKLSRQMPPSESDKNAVRQALVAVHLSEYAKRSANTLSGGEFQRLRLAAALALESEILLLDEPTSAQDPAMAQMILTLLTDLAQTKTVFMISHDVALAQCCPGRILLLADGKQVADGAAADVLTQENLSRTYHCAVMENTSVHPFLFSGKFGKNE